MTSPNDIRTKVADKIIALLRRHRVIIVHKTPRAGATTSLILSLLKQKKRFLVIEPTNKIILDTILNNIKKHCGENEPVIIHVPSTKECPRNKAKIECNENLGELPYMYLPAGCKSCYLQKECPVTRILHEEHIDGIALTYDKLVALVFTAQLFEKSVACAILDTILESIDVVVLDEAHELMYEKISSLEITRKHGTDFVSELMKKIIKLSDFLGEKDQFRELKFLIQNYSRIMNSPEVKSTEVKLLAILNDRKNSNHSKHQAASIQNPHLNLAIRTALEKEEGPKGNKNYTPDGHFIGEIDDYKLVEGSKIIYEKIVELTDYIGEFGISLNHVLALCDMLNIIKSEQLTIHCQKRLKITYQGDKRIETWVDETEICAIDELRLEALRSFLCMHKGKILITSATLCSYDYSTLLRIKRPIKEVLFGPNGDPLNTNAKMTIFADTKSFSGYGPYSVYNQREDIMQKCKDIMDIFGSENCLIICMNKDDCRMFKKLFAGTNYQPQITYYKAPEVMGVESNRRVGILIGLSHKPGHAFDAMRPNARESQILKVESMHADVAQAGSRLKDPAGINVSLLFAIGCREADLYDAFSWGIGRSLTTQIREDSDRPKVTGVAIAGESCSKPTIVFQKSWPETLISSVLCKNSLYSKPQKVPYISDSNGTFLTYEYKINSRCSLVDRLFSDQKVIALFKNEQIILTTNLIAKHCAKKIKLDFYTLQPDNTVNFVMFESKNEYAINRLKLFLDNLSIPYVIERIVPIVRIKQNPDNLRVWIFLNNTPADRARAFAESILKIAGFNIRGDKEIEYYPRQTKRNAHDIGERLPMSFGANSEILVDGKFVKEFDELTLGCVDLSSQPSDSEPNKWISGEGDESSVAFDV